MILSFGHVELDPIFQLVAVLLDKLDGGPKFALSRISFAFLIPVGLNDRVMMCTASNTSLNVHQPRFCGICGGSDLPCRDWNRSWKTYPNPHKLLSSWLNPGSAVAVPLPCCASASYN